MNGKKPRSWNPRTALSGLAACATIMAAVCAHVTGGEAQVYGSDPMRLHCAVGWLAFAMLLVFFALKYRVAAASVDTSGRDWVDWLDEGASIAVYVSLFILPLLGWGLAYAHTQGKAFDSGLVYTLRSFHGTVAWALAAVLLLRLAIALWRYKQGAAGRGEPESESRYVLPFPSPLEGEDAPQGRERGLLGRENAVGDDALPPLPPAPPPQGGRGVNRTLPEPSSPRMPRWLFSAEPDALVDLFMRYPPGDFEPFVCVTGMPGFWTAFDLLTTADGRTLAMIGKIPGNRHLRRWLQWRTCFMGSTVSEYCPLPHVGADALVQGMFRAWDRKTALLLVKDIPCNAPFLSRQANRLADQLVDACKANGFFMIEGQALAWVPIDFADEDAYLAQLSASRRRDIRRKLRSRRELHVDIVATGDAYLAQPGIAVELYAQYLEVYIQSTIHFDLLTPDFFKAMLCDPSLDGRIFLYYLEDRLIGYNLCFIHEGMLVDKYIGLRYPMARECNLYFVSWMENLAFARREGLRYYIAGWTDPAVKAALGARFTPTRHAVYVRNPLLRPLLRRIAGRFEPDREWFDAPNAPMPPG
jgi:cytochrome b561